MQRISLMLGGAGLAAIATALVLTASPVLAQSGMRQPATASPEQNAPQGQYGGMQGSQTPTAAEPLSTLSNPSSSLATATVQDSTGKSIGQVKSVQTSAAGTAKSVTVSLTTGDNTGKVVNIKADNLMFDANSNTVKSSLTLQEIDQLPTSQSSTQSP